MKKVLFLFLICAGNIFAQNRFQFQVTSQYQSPIKSQMPAMNTNLGLGFSFGYKPNDLLPMHLQFSYLHSYNSNYHVSRNAILNAGYLSNYNYKYTINYTSYFNSYLIGLKFETGNEFSVVRLFATPELGLISFNSKYSTIDANNPFGNYYQQHSKYNDWDEDDIVYHTKRFQHELCYAYGLQAGIEISINKLREKSKNTDDRLVLSGGFLRGCKDFTYLNLANIREVNVSPSATDELNLPSNSSMNVAASTPINITRFMMWGIQLGYVFVF